MRASLLFVMALGILHSTTAQKSAKHFQHTLETTAPAADIWRIWTDVDRWPTWDIGLQQAALAGPFARSTRGTLVSDQGQKAKFIITAVDEGKSYTFRTQLPLGSLEITRSLTDENDTVQFTHVVRFRGLTGGLFARKLGKGYRKMLPEAMRRIKQQAENR
jgi:hypothetical protein